MNHIFVSYSSFVCLSHMPYKTKYYHAVPQSSHKIFVPSPEMLIVLYFSVTLLFICIIILLLYIMEWQGGVIIQ